METVRAVRGRSRGWLLVGTVAAALWAGGCTSYTKKTLYGPGPRANGPDQPDVTAATSNSARLQSLPGPVQSSFLHEYAGATITSIHMQPTGTGAMYYQIVYIQDGAPGQVTYRSDGRDLASGEETGVIVREEPGFVPIARPTGSTTAPSGKDYQ